MTTETTSQDRVRVVVAEGVELVRRGICGVLAQRDEPFELAAEIGRLEMLPRACELLAPDVIVLSLRNSGQPSGDLSLLRQALAIQPAIRAIVLLERDDVEDILGAVHAGASGVLLREASAELLLAAIRDVLAGGAALDPRLARRLFECLSSGMDVSRRDAVEPQMNIAVMGALSQREREVLDALAHGCRNKEISRQLGVRVGTVKTHLRHIFRKLHVADRTAAVLVALQGKAPKAA